MNKSKTSLVLMELIISILFFSLASAVCVQLFVRAHLTTKETKYLNEAVNITQSISEVMNGTDGSLEQIKACFPSAVGDDDYFVIYYDENFKETDNIENAAFVADVTVSSVSKLYNMDVTFAKFIDGTDDVEIIYSLSSSKYIRKSSK